MATVFYLPSRGLSPSGLAPAAPPVNNTEWTDTRYLNRYPTSTTKASTPMTTISISGGGSGLLDLIIGQWISAPLTAGQSVTSQTINIVALCDESSLSNNLFLTWKVYIINSADNNIQKTLIAKRDDGTEVTLTTLTSVTDSATSTAGTYTTVAQDRIVIEIGLKGDPSTVFTHNGDIRIGDAAAADLAYTDGVTTDNNPTVQFATDTLTFVTESFKATTDLNNYKFVRVGDGMSTTEKIR